MTPESLPCSTPRCLPPEQKTAECEKQALGWGELYAAVSLQNDLRNPNPGGFRDTAWSSAAGTDMLGSAPTDT